MDFIHRTAEGQNLSAQDKRGALAVLLPLPFFDKKKQFVQHQRSSHRAFMTYSSLKFELRSVLFGQYVLLWPFP
jgi:hypothetical protein